MNTSNISPIIVEKAPIILEAIKSAKSILLHCHPSPDPDSVGSALAMKFALQSLGKDVTVIAGDSEIPEAFMHFPGAKDIVPKNFSEIDLNKYDLFIIQDSASLNMISKKTEVRFPNSLKTVVIDHHKTNEVKADIILVVPEYAATTEVLHDLFGVWNMKIDKSIASNLYIGIYTDTGGLKYELTTQHTYEIMAELVRLTPYFSDLIAQMENSETPENIKFYGLALNNIHVYGNIIAISCVSLDNLKKLGIKDTKMGTGYISSLMRNVKDWPVVCVAVEQEPGKTKCSFRSTDTEKHDVSRLASALGGGGHKGASGTVLNMSLRDSILKIASTAEALYNL